MGPGWQQAVRFAPGTRLRYTVSLAAAMRSTLEQASARASDWLRAIDGAIVTVAACEPAGCAVRVEAGAGCAAIEATDASSGAFDVHVLVAGAHAHERTMREVTIMLGGKHEAFIAERTANGPQHWLKLRYDRTGTGVELALFTAPFALHVAPAVRALLPTMVVVGRLEPLHDGPVV